MISASVGPLDVPYGSRFVFVTGGYQIIHQQFLSYESKHKNNNSLQVYIVNKLKEYTYLANYVKG